MQDLPRPGPIAWVPNALSVLRLGAAVALPFVPEPWRLALVLYAGLSDFVDGLIARRYGAASVVGGVLDVAGDKLFTWSAVLTFWRAGALEGWAVPLLLARDAVVVVVAATMAVGGAWSIVRRLRPRPLGKATTFALYALFIALAAWPDAAHWLLVPAMAFGVGAALDYLVAFAAAWRHARAG